LGWIVQPPVKRAPAPATSGFSLVSASKGTTPAPGYGNFLPVVKAAPVPKTLPAGIEPWGTVNWGDVSPFGSWGGESSNEWTPAGYDDTANAGQGPGWSPGMNLQSDPNYQAALNAEQLGVSQLDAQRLAARNRAVIEFGDPALAGLAGFGLDPQSADFAKQNYLSGNATMSRLDKSRDDAKRNVINALAGKGLLFSGETGYQEGEVGSEYGRNVYDARNKVLDSLRTVDQNYLDRKSSLHDRVVQALQQAFYFAAQNGGVAGGGGSGGGGGGGGGLEWDPGSQKGVTNAGLSTGAVAQAAAQYAAARGFTPLAVKQEGHIEVKNGIPGVQVKYQTPQGTSTEWTPIG
jgi:hypothetical protein